MMTQNVKELNNAKEIYSSIDCNFLLQVAARLLKLRFKEVPVYQIETVYVTVPSHLLKLNTIPTPPKKSVYINASSDMKEDLMIRYSQSLISELRMCVADKRSITNIMDEKNESWRRKR
jgi:hypothetical protein